MKRGHFLQATLLTLTLFLVGALQGLWAEGTEKVPEAGDLSGVWIRGKQEWHIIHDVEKKFILIQRPIPGRRGEYQDFRGKISGNRITATHLVTFDDTNREFPRKIRQELIKRKVTWKLDLLLTEGCKIEGEFDAGKVEWNPSAKSIVRIMPNPKKVVLLRKEKNLAKAPGDPPNLSRDEHGGWWRGYQSVPPEIPDAFERAGIPSSPIFVYFEQWGGWTAVELFSPEDRATLGLYVRTGDQGVIRIPRSHLNESNSCINANIISARDLVIQNLAHELWHAYYHQVVSRGHAEGMEAAFNDLIGWLHTVTLELVSGWPEPYWNDTDWAMFAEEYIGQLTGRVLERWQDLRDSVRRGSRSRSQAQAEWDSYLNGTHSRYAQQFGRIEAYRHSGASTYRVNPPPDSSYIRRLASLFGIRQMR